MAERIICLDSPEALQQEGLALTIEAWEDGQRIGTHAGTFEWWYFDTNFTDGSNAVIIFLTKPFLRRDRLLQPTVQISITRQDGTLLHAYPTYPAAQFHAATDRCDVRSGPNWVRGDLHHYELHAEAPGLAADLSFTSMVPAWRSNLSKMYFDAAKTEYFGWLPAMPFAKVEGKLHYDGQTHQVQGSGYHDHNWGNIGMEQMMHHWYWGRARVGEWTTIFVEIVSSRKFQNQVLHTFLLAKDDQILISAGNGLTLRIADEQPHPGGKTYPRSLDFDWRGAADAGNVQLALRNPKAIESISLLLNLPVWQRVLARLITNPYYFRFTTDLTMKVERQDQQITEQGYALFELMYLQ